MSAMSLFRLKKSGGPRDLELAMAGLKLGKTVLILMTAGARHIPQSLLDQLANGGRLVGPVGAAGAQDLMLIEKDGRVSQFLR